MKILKNILIVTFAVVFAHNPNPYLPKFKNLDPFVGSGQAPSHQNGYGYGDTGYGVWVHPQHPEPRQYYPWGKVPPWGRYLEREAPRNDVSNIL